MQPKELSPVRVAAEDTWNKPRERESRLSFIQNKLAAPALANIEFDELPEAA